MQTPQNSTQLLLAIQNKYASFPHALKRIADYVLSSAETAMYQSIGEVALAVGVSEASISKFVKELQFKGFREFKICLARDPQTAEKTWMDEDIRLDDDFGEICNKLFSKNIASLKNTLSILDTSIIEDIASKICKTKRVDLYGQGGSILPALGAAMRLQRIGIQAAQFTDSHMQITSASLLSKEDIAIGISNSGQTKDTIDALQTAKNAGATTVCITSNAGSPITKVADITLLTAYTHSEIIDDILVSRLAELSILDALYLCIARKTKKRALESLYKTDAALRTKKSTK